MQRKTIIRSAVTGLATSFMVIGGLIAFQGSVSSAKQAEAAVGNYTTDINSYYNNITATSGNSLLGALHDLQCKTHQTFTIYDDFGKNEYQKVLDADPNNAGKVIDFYSQVSWPGTWDPTSGSTTGGYNREHVWCQSKSGGLWNSTTGSTKGGGGDAHHVRPLEYRENSTRNNNPFGVVTNKNSSTIKYAKLGTNQTYAQGGWLENGVWEPIDASKGDVARILMYVFTHYNTYSNVYGTTDGSGFVSTYDSGYYGTLSITDIVSTASNTAAASWALLLQWNDLDPVNSLETTRNEVAAKYQGNRNPFIDYPDLADCIWGTEAWDWTSRSVSTGPRISLNKTSATIAVNDTVNLSATASGGTGSVSWTSSNTTVATVSASTGSSITVTGKKAGSATITASYNGITAKCAVIVSNSAPLVTSVSVSPASVELDLAGTKTATLTATVNGTNSPSQNVTWSSDNSSVAYVDSNGIVTAKSKGTATITATSVEDDRQSGTCSVTVVKTGEINLSETTYELVNSMNEFDSSRKMAIVASGYNYAISTTQNTNNRARVAIVKDTNANTISVVSGLATFNIQEGSVSGTYAFYDGANTGYLYAASSSSNYLKTQGNIDANASFSITIDAGIATIKAQGDKTRNWIRHNNTNGLFSCYGSGQTDVSLYQQKEIQSGDVYVSGVSLNNSALTLEKGASASLVATVSPSEATNKNVTWVSSVPSVATIDENGVVTAVSVGTTEITVETEDGGFIDTCIVTVISQSSGSEYYEAQSSVSAITTGQYVICAKNGSSYYPMGSTIGSNNKIVSSTPINVSNGKISTAAASNYVVTLTVSNSTVTIKLSNDKYLTHTSSTDISSNTNSYDWTLSVGTNGSFRLVAASTANQSTVRCLAYRAGTYNYFGAFSVATPSEGSTEYFDIELFKYTQGGSVYSLDNFVEEFLTHITCDSTGATSPTFASGYSWSVLKTKYNSLTIAEQNELKTYVADANGNDEAKCVARYDYIVGKYGTTKYENFMNRTIVSHSNNLGNQVVSHNAMLFLVVAATLGTFTFAAWFIHKKKQYDL